MRVGDISFAIFLLICSSRIFLFSFLSFFGKIRRKTGKINFMLNDGVENSSSSFELNGIFFFFFINVRLLNFISYIHFEEVVLKLQTNRVINVIFNIRFLLMESVEKV